MSIDDFSNEFDVLMNSWAFPVQQGNAMSPVALNEYEKSIYLTRAQDDIVKNYFSPQHNQQGEGLGYSRKRDIDFSMIIKNEELSDYVGEVVKFNDNGVMFTLPDDMLFILNESCKATKNSKEEELTVVPVSQNEYERIMLKPYRFPYKRQAWRLIHSDDSESIIEVIPEFGYTDVSYKMRYVRYPDPIILEDLDGSGLEIRNSTTAQGCKLSEELHTEILARAVELAKAHIIGNIQQVTDATQPERRDE